MKKSMILYSGLYILLFISVTYISGISGLFSFIFSLLLYFFIFYGLYRFFKLFFRKKEVLGMQAFFVRFLQKIGLSILMIIILVGAFGVYQNIINPASLPLYTLSNGEQTIRFQTMSHIASGEFYAGVRDSIIEAKRDDYVLYYEGVRPGSEENTENFNRALGINFNTDLYDNLSTLYGIEAQNNRDFLELVNNRDYNVDISVDEIISLYAERPNNTLGNSEIVSTDLSSEIFDRLADINPRQLAILRFFNQAMLNFIMKNDSFRETIINNFGNTNLFDVILDERNEVVVDTISSRDDENIFIIYGLMHFEGIFELLQQEDQSWKIVETQNKQAIIAF